MTDYTLKRNYRQQVLVAAPGDPPVGGGEWRVSKGYKPKSYYWLPPGSPVMAYSRTSKAGEHLKGGGDGLANWKACMAALGTVMNDSVRSEIATLINQYDGDPYYKGDERDSSHSGKARLLEAVELACKVAGTDTASARGTEFHHLAETVNKGKTPQIIQPHLEGFLHHYQDRVAPITFLAQEILIVNDAIHRAGSIDYLMQLPAGLTTPDGQVHDGPLVCAGDLKTGKWDIEYPGGVSAQLAGYGLGLRYDQETNLRYPLHPHASDRWAVIVHFPIAEPHAEVAFYWVDMHVGIEAAKLNNRLDAMVKYYRSTAGKPIQFQL